MKTAIYLRVSTERQDVDSQTVELREYCARRGWTEVTEYSDICSGTIFSREGLDRMMRDVRHGRIQTVVAYKLDRLGRSLGHLAQLVSELTNHRVALVIPGQGIDTSSSNPASQLQLNILMAVAEFEREIIRERVRSGLKAAKARGVKFGRPCTLDHHFAAVRSLLQSGMGVRPIARQLGIPVSSAHKLVQQARTMAET